LTRPRRILCILALLATLLPVLPGWVSGVACAQSPDPYREQRERMVEEQIRSRGVRQPEVLNAMSEVPRHLFIPERVREQAYEDKPVPIDYDQTISQPYIVALMTELLDLSGDEKVLEIGTGSGYHSAILSKVADEVYTIEIIEPLADRAVVRLRALGFGNVRVRYGDGYDGWPEAAPFDAIILTAAPPRLPQPLIDQLKIGGKMVVPVGDYLQDLQLITKTGEHDYTKQRIAPVRFVPMTGEVQKGRGNE
jgi:protein-L-isoaspartate(D-aspartate) O-methyltransferase